MEYLGVFLLSPFEDAMVIRNWFTEASIKAALNVVPPSPSSYARFLENFLEGIPADKPSDTRQQPVGPADAFLREWADDTTRRIGNRQVGFLQNYLARAPTVQPKPEAHTHGWKLPETISRQESYPFRDALMSAHLRVYVDAWLQTGLHADGSEWPGQRNLSKAQDALSDLWGYLERSSPELNPITKDADFWDLELSIALPTAYSGEVHDFFEAQIVEARRHFLGIMVSNWKDRLCKCRYRRCGIYFLHPRPRRSYRHGTFCCLAHTRSAAAKGCFGKSRTEGKQKLVEAAARMLVKQGVADSRWQDDAWLGKSLAEKLCIVIAAERLHGYRDQVKVNWVTRNQDVIEKMRVQMHDTSEASVSAALGNR